MGRIKLTQGKYALVDDGDFAYLSQWKWRYGCRGYAYRSENKKMIYMHRFINNTPKGLDTDHINRDRLDNQRCNLRSVTRSANLFNTKIRVNNKSGHTGVCWETKARKWIAYAMVEGKRTHLGSFSDLEKAVRTRSLFVNKQGI